jgi:hypothetical protein
MFCEDEKVSILIRRNVNPVGWHINNAGTVIFNLELCPFSSDLRYVICGTKCNPFFVLIGLSEILID